VYIPRQSDGIYTSRHRSLKDSAAGCILIAYVLFFGCFLSIFLFDFDQNPVMNGWICKFEWLSLYNPSVPEIFQWFFSRLNAFTHSEMQFKQQKIEILSKFTSPDSDQFQ
jgi:hypothetical protein